MVCPLDYYHHASNPEIQQYSYGEGNSRNNNLDRDIRREKMLMQKILPKLQPPSPPPIEIVRQAGAFVEFVVRDDSPFFSSIAATGGAAATATPTPQPDAATESFEEPPLLLPPTEVIYGVLR